MTHLASLLVFSISLSYRSHYYADGYDTNGLPFQHSCSRRLAID